MGAELTIRIGLVGTNTSHAGTFAGLLNGEGGEEPQVPGGRVVGVWSSGNPSMHDVPNPDAAQLAERFGIDRVVAAPEELVGSIDAVLVVDDTGGGALHAELARPFLEAGVPTFVDKPMTTNASDAAGLFDLAEQHGAPLMSSSALRFSAKLQRLTEDLPRVGEISSVVSVGTGEWRHYGVHMVEIAQIAAGRGMSWVHQHPGERRDVTLICYDSGPTVVVENLRDSAYVFHIVVYGAAGMAEAMISDYDHMFAGTVAAAVEMARTGTSPVSREETLEVMRVLDAGHRSAEAGGPVPVDDTRAGVAR